MMKRRFALLIGCLALVITALLGACGAAPRAVTSAPATSLPAPQSTAAPTPVLTDLRSPDDLKARFNQDAGIPPFAALRMGSLFRVHVSPLVSPWTSRPWMR